MNESIINEFPFFKVDHVGYVVNDVDKSIGCITALGIGPFGPGHPGRPPGGRPMRGLPEDLKLKVRVAEIGDLRVELIQPVSGDTVLNRFLKEQGEGMHHIAFAVDDIDKESAKMVEKGFKITLAGRNLKGGGGFSYFDAGKVKGLVVELVQWPSEQ